MKFKGTTSEWKITEICEHRIRINGTSIDVWFGLSQSTETEEQSRANAKLIVAAPALLEALLLLKDELYHVIERFHGTAAAKSSCSIATAEKAINKALQ
jgi:hypothetical protein